MLPGKGSKPFPVHLVGWGMANDSDAKREFELSLKKSAGGWSGKMSPEEEEELRKLREKQSAAMKRRTVAMNYE